MRYDSNCKRGKQTELTEYLEKATLSYFNKINSKVCQSVSLLFYTYRRKGKANKSYKGYRYEF